MSSPGPSPSTSASSNPRFSRLLTTVLGSPFLTTTEVSSFSRTSAGNSYVRASSEPPPLSLSPTLDLLPERESSLNKPSTPPRSHRYPIEVPDRPSSPSPSIAGFSLIGVDEAEDSSDYYGYSPYKAFGSLGRRAANYSAPTLNYFSSAQEFPNTTSTSFGTPSTSFKSILPRIWDALISSPSRNVMSPSRQALATPNSRHSVYNYSSLSSPLKKGKGKLFHKNDVYSRDTYAGHVDYVSLPPLDGEEGELIDDEACFVAVDFWGADIKDRASRARVVTGIDILSLLPPELALHVLCLLSSSSAPNYDIGSSITSLSNEQESDPLDAIITCLSISKTWRRLAGDNSVWRALFACRWGRVTETRIEKYLVSQERKLRRKQESQSQKSRRELVPRRSASVGGKDMFTMSRDKKLPAIPDDKSIKSVASDATGASSASNTLDWHQLYRERLELEKRWSGKAVVTSPPSSAQLLRHPASPSSTAVISAKGAQEQWEPTVLRISGHSDSVYCLEFTTEHIITGSRDRTIKVWSQKTGRCLGTFGRTTEPNDASDAEIQGHKGSVLCLKFFWEDEESEDTADEQGVVVPPDSEANVIPGFAGRQWKSRRGILFSGSSDCTVAVWDLSTHPKQPWRRRSSAWIHSRRWEDGESQDEEEYEVKARVNTVLRGHGGGVLDLRVDKRWIVSCSKDAVICVWNRQTQALHRTLRGHEGPVNAVGLEGGKVVSASGDGKMILWDIESGERLRTFEGHDRGLACIEFQNDLIISGSNDCKIKIWSASTGECLRTLVGHEALVRALAYDPRSGRLVSASYDKSVRVWDVGSGKMVREFKDNHTSHIFDVKFNVSRIVSTSHDQKIVVIDFTRGIESTSLFV